MTETSRKLQKGKADCSERRAIIFKMEITIKERKEELIVQIQEFGYSNLPTQVVLAKRYGVSQQQIYKDLKQINFKLDPKINSYFIKKKRTEELKILSYQKLIQKMMEEIKKEIKNLREYRGFIAQKNKIKSELFTEQEGKCNICKQKLQKGYHIDHIFPYSKRDEYINGPQGISEKRNLQLLCPKCNMHKGAKIIKN